MVSHGPSVPLVLWRRTSILTLAKFRLSYSIGTLSLAFPPGPTDEMSTFSKLTL